jgi:hypothetical protein
MCRKNNRELACNLNGVLDRFKEHFDEVLNGDEKEVQEPSREDVETAI